MIRVPLIISGGQIRQKPSDDLVEGVPQDDQYVTSEAESSTTDTANYSDKLSVSLPAKTATYEIKWYAEMSRTSVGGQFIFRMYNSTDLTVLGEHYQRPVNAPDYYHVAGFARVAVTGSAKTLVMQFKNGTQSGGTRTTYIRRARITVKRVV